MARSPHSALRSIPAVETVLHHPRLDALRPRFGHAALVRLIRRVLADIRAGMLESAAGGEITEADVADRIVFEGERLLTVGPMPVLNATGVILHTNLGRAPLSAAALAAVQAVAAGYSNLEYDLERGARGSRMSHVEDLLAFLTGAEAAMAVNNNAAAVLLALNSLAEGREVLVSRGELVEIGGSFRIPEIMQKSGARLREVGTTNKTHARDFENAISDATGLLLKVHTSNYRIEGFTAEVPLAELAEIGERRGLPLVVDVGSGALLDVSPAGVAREPLVSECLEQGAALVTFSGDKLLGGPQAGLIVGRRDLIVRLRENPLARAVRLDKMSLAALAATLAGFARPEEAWRTNPVLGMMGRTATDLEAAARSLATAIRQVAGDRIEAEVYPAETAVGGGALPLSGLTTWTVALRAAGLSADGLERRLRRGRPPVIARIQEDRVRLDVRTLDPDDMTRLPGLIARCLDAAPPAA